MRASRPIAAGTLLAWLLAAGCTTLREVPRGEYASRPERKAVRIETREGLIYDFDYATIDADTLIGYRNRPDVEGPLEQVAVVHVALDDITRLKSRSLDWYRTGIVGGTLLVAAIAAGLAARAPNANDPGVTSGGGGGRGPEPSRAGSNH